MKKQAKDKESTIKHLEEKIKEDSCPICFDDEIECPCLTPCCKSKFCIKCLLTALNHTKVCPYCRSEISADTITLIGDSAKIKKEEKERR